MDNREENAGPEGTADPISQAVKELFGLSYLFPYQRLVVANILEAAAAAGIAVRWPGGPDGTGAAAVSAGETPAEDDCGAETDTASRGRQIVILPTGAGKSLCFQFPAMLLGGATLVLYPILSLMADQERRLRERGFSPVLLRGGQSREEREEIWRKIRSGESRFIISNPETLLVPAVMEKLPELGIVHLVIDEAHCVSEWGESFRPSYLEIGRIVRAVKTPAGGEALVTAFTATASAPVLEKIERYIFGGAGIPDGGISGGDDAPAAGGEGPAGTVSAASATPASTAPEFRAHRIVGNPGRINIAYAAVGCLAKDPAVRDFLRTMARPAIVFCSSRPGTEKLARYLRNELDEREIRFYHAGLSREEKKDVEDWFFASGTGVLVSTCAYGMGVDKPDIRTVIHRDCPPSVEAYLQESGRAGRDGGESSALLLWGQEDALVLHRAGTPAARKRLEALLAYAHDTERCRREALLVLLDYEGQGESPPSQCCDVCDGRARNVPREEEALLAFFRRNRRRFSLAEAAPILAGNDGRWTAEECRRAVNVLAAEGKLLETRGIFWKKKIVAVRHRPG